MKFNSWVAIFGITAGLGLVVLGEMKMKIRMYMDVYKGFDPTTCAMFASSRPSAKSEGSTRIGFSVDVPDYLLTAVDIEAPITSNIEEIES